MAPARADVFLDVTSVTPGGPGTGVFSGMLGGIAVSGSISALGGPPAMFFNAPGPGIGDSTLDGSSPQYSDPTVFSPTIPTTDRVGFTYVSGAGNLVTLTFSKPVTNPVFHVANLDGVGFLFAPTPGFTSLTLLKGNDGADGDGIDPGFGGAGYGYSMVYDLSPGSSDSTPPTMPPPTTGPRSAYGSVRINGTFSTILFVTDGMGPPTDSGSFTLSIVPEPSSIVLAGIGAVVLIGFVRCRKR